MIICQSELTIGTHASLADWRSLCLEQEIGVSWKQQKIRHYLNGLELRATSYAIRIFPHLDPGIWSVHVQMDTMVAFFHSVKKEDIQKQMRPD